MMEVLFQQRPYVEQDLPELVLRTGEGQSIGQFGELFQGQIEDQFGKLRRCLVSLPCSAIASQARFVPEKYVGLSVKPAHKQKALKVAQLVLARCNAARVGGTLLIESTVPEAKGCGSSTADCIAVAIAAADAVGEQLSEEELGSLVVEGEVASDNFMFQRAVLFAHREGVVLEDYACPLPNVVVLGFDAAQDDLVDTLTHPPAEYSWRQRQSFCALTGALRRAVREGDIRLLGRVATASAFMNQIFLPKPKFHEIHRIAEHSGALGITVAHSGTVMSILLDPMDCRLETKVESLKKNLLSLGLSNVLQFEI
jgi:uncharacterized protein involved in propanediol utilization